MFYECLEISENKTASRLQRELNAPLMMRIGHRQLLPLAPENGDGTAQIREYVTFRSNETRKVNRSDLHHPLAVF